MNEPTSPRAEKDGVRLTGAEREWIALTILDAVAERSAEDASRLIEARIETLIARRIAPVQAVLDDDTARRRACAESCDCPCAYKDCYECGKWHNCIHTPLNAVRDALRIPAEQS
ncbi:MAG: hypothetical protein CMJ18_07820 [Phycisphaeraceae bacterium]|nr:hypothetical protein [Phycisphaeraceae bacterium]